MFSRMKNWITNGGSSSPPLAPLAPVPKIQGTSLMNKNACSKCEMLDQGETATFEADSNCYVQAYVVLSHAENGLIEVDLAGVKMPLGVTVQSVLLLHSGPGVLLLAGEQITVTNRSTGLVTVRFAALDVSEGRTLL